MHERDMRETVATTSTTFASIETVSWGSGNDLMQLLHASATGPHAYAGLAACLERPHRHLLAPAFVGYGATRPGAAAPSDHTAQNRAIANHGLDADRSLGTERPGRRILFGHSMGGLVAILVALDQAEGGRPLDALILYEPIVHDSLDHTVQADAAALAWDRDIIAAMTDDVRGGCAEQGVRRFVEAWNEVAWQDLPQVARANLIANADNLVRETTAMPHQRLAPARLQQLTTPTLLLHGDQSPSFVQLVVARLAAVLPAARAVVLPGCGHMAPLSRPRAVAAAIDGFVGDRDAL